MRPVTCVGTLVQKHSQTSESYGACQQMTPHCCCILDHVIAMTDTHHLQVCQLHWTDSITSHSLTCKELHPVELTLLLPLLSCAKHIELHESINESWAAVLAATYIQKRSIVVINCTLRCLVTCLTRQMDVASGICGVIQQ